jgi:hypothetical protein
MRRTAGIPALTLIARSAAAQGWDMRAAAGYLDARQTWWSAWPTAARDHQTACVSCHTALPYALAGPLLRAAPRGRTDESERKLVDDAGSWAWLNFHLEPWEADDAAYFGAALAAIAAGTEPGGYASRADIQ